MALVLPFGVAWPAAADFNPAYGVASIVALFGAIWFMVFLKRTADEHYRLLRREKKKRRRAQRDRGGAEGGPLPGSSGRVVSDGAVRNR
jgi:hypothetical protein